ncbi:MAG: metallophosphoesterase [Hyphomicrobium sp.]
MLTRRDVLKALAAIGVGGGGFAGYALAEAAGVTVTIYRITPPHWTPGLKVRLAVLADPHICHPWMSLERLARIVEQTNRLGADAILLLGDYVVGRRLGRFSRLVPASAWAEVFGRLKAPLGVHAVLGNHDWWDDLEVQHRRAGPTPAGLALQNVNIPVYENHAVRLTKDGRAFWIAGLGDQWAFWPRRGEQEDVEREGDKFFGGVDDLPKTLSMVTDNAPIVIMAHEPDIFPQMSDRVSLTISGHTHGGQVRIFGYAHWVPSRFGRRYLYGHIIENDRHLVVSGGLGCSGLPVRVGAPPEIVVVELGSEAPA